MKHPFVTLILAGGRGTRMGSSDKHKVCFEVLGVPVIHRALDTYNLCGSRLNVVVVGMLAEKVMATVAGRFPGTAFAFQDQPLGTGHAARMGAEILERMRYDGHVLVVAGDKVIAPKVVRGLLERHEKSGADVTVATATRPPDSSGGIILQTRAGQIVGILEAAELRRLLALKEVSRWLEQQARLSYAAVRVFLSQRLPEKQLRALMDELWHDTPQNTPLTRARYEAQLPQADREGLIRAGRQWVPAGEAGSRFPEGNLSTYLFHAPVLYDVLHRLKAARRGQEEYLTDVFDLLTRGARPAKIVGHHVAEADDIMAFNNPQELLAIEEACRRREGGAPAEVRAASSTLASTQEWSNLLQSPSAAARRAFRQWYGEDLPLAQFQSALQNFVQKYGAQPQAAVIRSPGRINLLGRHIDHQGGSVNVMAINREILLVAAPRADDIVRLANAQGAVFAEHTFRVSDLIASLNWDDWQQVVDGPRNHRLLEAARGEWFNYIKAAMLRLQMQFRDRRLRGMDVMVSGVIPMGAGLSSSSALVVAAAEATIAFNQLPVSALNLVSLCGEGEWFVGTRGGAADHAAIKLSRRGYVTRVGFFPFRLEGTAPFLPGHELIVCNSNIYADKSGGARHLFNQKVACYHIGRIYLKHLRPDLAPRIAHLRDVTPGVLGLTPAEFRQLLARLPESLTRAQVRASFAEMTETERDLLERLFATHDAPAEGYAVRAVVLFGLAEMERAQRCLDLLRRKDAAALGRFMNISHDGDRVARPDGRGQWQRVEGMPRKLGPDDWESALEAAGDLALVPGAYGCSLPELDRIADLARAMPGVKGAQLAGAGLGGCVMVLVEKQHAGDVLQALGSRGLQAELFRPIAGACRLVNA